MSIDSTIARVAAIDAQLRNPALLAQGEIPVSQSGGVAVALPGGAPASEQAQSFASTLQQALIEPSSSEGSPAPGYSTGFAPPATPLDEPMGAQGAQSTPVSALPGAYAADPYGALESPYGTFGVGALSSPYLPTTPASATVGSEIVAIAESQAGRREEPMGSNEGSAISMYRSATREAIPGAPWCAYFASWVARQAGVPLGAEGQGLGSVAQIWEWAQSTGRAITNGPGVVPKPGDLIVFGDEHVGIVRGLLPDGKIATIEGNYENQVALNERSPSEPTGYVEL